MSLYLPPALVTHYQPRVMQIDAHVNRLGCAKVNVPLFSATRPSSPRLSSIARAAIQNSSDTEMAKAEPVTAKPHSYNPSVHTFLVQQHLASSAKVAAASGALFSTLHATLGDSW